MKHVFLFSILIMFSCQNKDAKEPQVQEILPVVLESVIVEYYFLAATIDYPFLEETERYSYSLDGMHSYYDPYYEIIYKSKVAVTDVEKNEGEINEDLKYMLLDSREKYIKDAEFYKSNIDFANQIAGKYGNLKTIAGANLNTNEQKVRLTSRKIFIFKSYKEASVLRRTILEDGKYSPDKY